jgi:hypothetical protein
VDQQQLTLADLEQAVKELGGPKEGLETPCYLTSAKTGEAVEALFRDLGRMVIG